GFDSGRRESHTVPRAADGPGRSFHVLRQPGEWEVGGERSRRLQSFLGDRRHAGEQAMNTALIRREHITLLRQRRMVLMQCSLAIAFALLVIIRWPTEPRISLSGSRAQEVFRLLSLGLLSALLLLLPVFPATSIVKERNSGTLALLLNTPLGPLRIFFGKLLAVLGVAGLILALSLPAAAACFAMSGASWKHTQVYLVLVLTALQ